MIRFACPSCQTVMSAPPDKAGTKFPCPQCGQRLQVPAPALDKTVLGNLVPEHAAAARRAAPLTPSPDAGWYYQRGGKRFGPVPTDQLRRLAGLKQMEPQDLVWREGMSQWAPVNTVPALWGAAPLNAPVVAVAPAPGGKSPGPRPAPRKRPLLFWGIVGGLGIGVVGAVAIVFLVFHWVRPRPEAAPEPPARVEVPTPPKTPPKPTPERPRDPTTTEIVARCKPSVALVRTDTGSGTGFLAGPNLLVTNFHVIGDGTVDKVRVFFPPGGKRDKEALPVRLLHEDRRRDLVLLEVRTDRAPLTIADSFAFEGGEEIIVIGNPGASAGEDVILENAVARGVMSTSTTLNGQAFYQLSVAVNPGNSGGPVFDGRGRVIGVVTRKAVGSRQEGLGFAIPLRDLKEALARVKGLNKADTDKVAARHDLVATFRQVAGTAREHVKALDIYAIGLVQAVQRGHNPQDAWDRATRDVNEGLKLGAVQRRFKADVEPALKRVLADGNTPEPARESLEELVGTIGAMRDHMKELRSVTGFLRGRKALIGDYKRHVDALKAALDADDVD